MNCTDLLPVTVTKVIQTKVQKYKKICGPITLKICRYFKVVVINV